MLQSKGMSSKWSSEGMTMLLFLERKLLAETQYRSNVGSSRSVPIVRTRLAMVAV